MPPSPFDREWGRVEVEPPVQRFRRDFRPEPVFADAAIRKGTRLLFVTARQWPERIIMEAELRDRSESIQKRILHLRDSL